MEDPSLFNRRAEAYERGRPPYPAALYERLGALGVMSTGRRVLDIGAGTGQAAAALVAAGATVTAVEPGADLAAHIVEKWPDVSVLEARLEDVGLPRAAFDAAVCATALHWIDLGVGLPKVHEALVEQGLFLPWWNVFGDPEHATAFRERVAAIVARRTAPATRAHPSPLDTDYWTHALASGGHFIVEQPALFRWQVEMTATSVRDLFSTFSDWSDSEVDEAVSAVDELGGAVTEHYATALYVCRAVTR